MSADEDLPIDIFYAKLLDWLIDRRWVKTDWHKSSTEVRALVTAAIMDMPDSEAITALLARSYINYFHCVQIVDLLKVSEADTKNIFGMYSSQRMKDWQEIVKRYQADHMFLGECANLLQHNVNYEIPALKRTIQRCQMKIKDAERKEIEYAAHGAQQMEKFRSLCKDMRIDGKDVTKELAELPKELPTIYESAVEAARGEQLKQALEYYAAFVAFNLDGTERQKEHSSSVCPLLRHVLDKGHTTVHEFKTGEVPPDPLPGEVVEVAGGSDAGGIDWGESEPQIDFGDDAGKIDFGDEPAIDFGDSDGAKIDFGEGDASGGIDWGISVEGEAAAAGAADGIDWGGDEPAKIDFGDGPAIDFGEGDAGSGGIDWGDAGGAAAASVPSQSINRKLLLHDSETRNLFVDELLELEGFLSQRILELQGAVDITSINQFADAPRVIQMQSHASVEAMLDAVTELNSILTNSRTQQLILMAGSPRFVERLAKSMLQRVELAEKMTKKVADLKEQKESARVEMQETAPKVDAMIAQTKELQSKVEVEIGKLYKGRKVNIIGEINNL